MIKKNKEEITKMLNFVKCFEFHGNQDIPYYVVFYHDKFSCEKIGEIKFDDCDSKFFIILDKEIKKLTSFHITELHHFMKDLESKERINKLNKRGI
jgi:uncharacterized protein (UPF0248 family)